MRFKDLLRAMFSAYFVITTGVTVSMYVSCLLFNPNGNLSPADIGGILLVALASDCSFIIFYSSKELTKRQMLFRFALHLPLLLVMLLFFARLFSWVNMKSPQQVAVFVLLVLVVYASTAAITLYRDKKTADKLNDSLKKRYHS